MYSQEVITRFWSHVNKNGPVPAHRPELGPCWVWTAALFWDGYGSFNSGGPTRKAHRVAWQLTGKRIPTGHCVLHECDRRTCVRARHLYTGTRADNARDRIQRGRGAVGEKHGRAKIREQVARDIVRRYANRGVTQQALADEYGLSRSHVGGIVTGKKWLYLER